MNPKLGHIDAALTNVSVMYKPTGFIADLVAPVVKVEKESDKYYVWNRADTFRKVDAKVAAGAESKRVDFELSNDQYYAEEYALHTSITWRAISNADSALRLESNKTKMLKNLLMIEREYRVAAIFTATASYASGLSTTYLGTSQWNNGSYAGDPIAEIDAKKELVRVACGVVPNVIIVPHSVATVLANNSAFRDRFKYVKEDVTSSGLPEYLRGMKVLTPGAQNTTSNEGAASTTVADIWGKNLIMAYVNPNETMDEITFVRTFRSQAEQVRKWEDDAKRSRMIEDNLVEDVKVTANTTAYLIKNVIS